MISSGNSFCFDDDSYVELGFIHLVDDFLQRLGRQFFGSPFSISSRMSFSVLRVGSSIWNCPLL